MSCQSKIASTCGHPNHGATGHACAPFQPTSDTLSVWLQQWVTAHGGTDLHDTGSHLVLECYCGADLGIRYGPTTPGRGREAEALAYFQHQATELLAHLSGSAPSVDTDRRLLTDQQTWERRLGGTDVAETRLLLDVDAEGRVRVHEAVLVQLLVDAGWERTA